MGMTLELPDDLTSAIQEEARRLGKDPSQYAIERMKNTFAVAKNVPAHLDRSRYMTAEQLRQHAREKHGFPESWGKNPTPLTESDWEQLEVIFAPDPEPIK